MRASNFLRWSVATAKSQRESAVAKDVLLLVCSDDNKATILNAKAMT